MSPMGVIATTLATVFGVMPVPGTGLTQAAQGIAIESAASAPAEGRIRLRRGTRGGAATVINAGFIDDLDPNTSLRGEKWIGSPTKIGIAGKMLRDPHVRATVHYIADAICAAKWKFKPASKRPIDVEAADYLNWALLERMPWSKVVGRSIRDYMPYGYSLHEITDDKVALPADRFPLHAGGGVGVAPTGFHHRPAWSVYEWEQSKRNTSQVHSITQWIPGSDAEKYGYPKIRADRLMRMTWEQEGANFAGFAPLRSAYGPWKLKKAFETIDAIKHERTGVGTPTITLGEDADEADIAAAEMILAEMRANEKGFLTLPYGFIFEWVGSSEANSSNIQLAIQRCNIDIAVNAISGLMLLGITGSSGSFALSNTQSGARHLHVDSHARFVTDAINHGQDGWSIVERLTRLNYGADVGMPMLQARLLPTRPWRDVVETTVKAIAAGLVTVDDNLETDVRDALEWGPHDPTTARERPVSLGTPPAKDDKDDTTNESEFS